MQTSLRWALIGASDIAATRILPAIRAAGGEAVVVRSGQAEHGSRWAHANGVAESVTDLSAALDRSDVDAVYVSSLNSLHRSHVEAAALAGKHVLAEKPLAMNLLDARAMVDACRSADVVMATNHHLPASPTHRVMKALVRSGQLGEIRGIRFHHAVLLPERLQGWRVDDPNEGGVIYDVTVHDAAATAAILGTDAIRAMAIGFNQDNDPNGPVDAVMSSIEWAGGVLVSTHDSYNNAHLPTGVHILGTDGALIAENCNTGDPVGTIALYRNQEWSDVDIPDRQDLYERTIHAFVAAVRGEGEPIVTGEDGVRSLAVAIAVAESTKSKTGVMVQRI